MRARPFAMLALGLLAMAEPSRAFPGVLVAKDDAVRSVRSTSVVLMQHGGYSVVTLMAEVEGPLAAWAFLIPVPGDVTASRLRTVRRATLGRVEAVSAPRLHAFYEQDPCDDAPLEQAWDEHIKVQGRGFLTPAGVPPADRRYAVSNAISRPVEPTFKEAESEFSYRLLSFDGPSGLVAALAKRGYRVSEMALAALAKGPGAPSKLLLAEVSPSRVELTRTARIQLGGIRYWSREPVLTLRESLGSTALGNDEELFIYVLDRKARYEAKTQPNVFLPSNVVLDPRAADRLASAYNALFEAVTQKSPGSVVVEYAWPTSGCGEPCPDAPLGMDELMTLGGDVLDAHTTTLLERAPEPPPERERDRERFETRLSELMPAERPAARREHAAERKEIARRDAILARHTYVLTRLHRRNDATSPPNDLVLGPAPAVTGGVGIPHGAAGALSERVVLEADSKLQTRFVSLYAWSRAVACSEPKRGRWGKRWASESRVSRAVPLATDLAAASADRGLLESVLVRSLPELGLSARSANEPSPSPPPAALPSAAPSAKAASPRGCSVAPTRPAGPRGSMLWLALTVSAVVGLVWRRCRGAVARHSREERLRGTLRNRYRWPRRSFPCR